jgi:DNA (cytosine-5)-methyltransferase 1
VKVLDLFSGIGGFSLGLERAGMETVAFCEIDPFCQKVLKKHWADVPCYNDVTKLTKEVLDNDGVRTIDVICGGFPCQDLSGAGRQKGLSATRSGLWFEMLRIISGVRPKYVIVENVSALLTGERGGWFSTFLTSLSQIGYNAEWETIYASQVGAPHPRERVWIIAYPCEVRRDYGILDNFQYEVPSYKEWDLPKDFQSGERWQHWLVKVHKASDGFISQSDFCAMDDGLSEELDAIAALGNAVVPQIPELIGRAIMNLTKNKE